MRKFFALGGLGAAALVGVSRVMAPGTRTRKRMRKAAFRTGQQLRYATGRVRGIEYKLRGRRPDPDVSDAVLADRVRSEIGTLEHTLDIPHIHVMVHDHVATLHGDVSSALDAKALEHAVLEVSGVRAVHSLLHVGLIAGDSRPSEGQADAARSEQYVRIVEAAQHAGAGGEMARAAVRAVLSTLADRLPGAEREHLFSHLPDDVRALMRPPRRRGIVIDVRSPEEFVQAVVATGAVDPTHGRIVVESILGALRLLVPEEDGDIGAVLPEQLQQLWESAVPQ